MLTITGGLVSSVSRSSRRSGGGLRSLRSAPWSGSSCCWWRSFLSMRASLALIDLALFRNRASCVSFGRVQRGVLFRRRLLALSLSSLARINVAVQRGCLLALPLGPVRRATFRAIAERFPPIVGCDRMSSVRPASGPHHVDSLWLYTRFLVPGSASAWRARPASPHSGVPPSRCGRRRALRDVAVMLGHRVAIGSAVLELLAGSRTRPVGSAAIISLPPSLPRGSSARCACCVPGVTTPDAVPRAVC